jgi:hypothetical protein
MKKLLLGLCLASLGVACRASTANMHDTSSCTGKDCAECKMECTGEKMESCTGEKSECSGEAKVCPVTGKPIN